MSPFAFKASPKIIFLDKFISLWVLETVEPDTASTLARLNFPIVEPSIVLSKNVAFATDELNILFRIIGINHPLLK